MPAPMAGNSAKAPRAGYNKGAQALTKALAAFAEAETSTIQSRDKPARYDC